MLRRRRVLLRAFPGWGKDVVRISVAMLSETATEPCLVSIHPEYGPSRAREWAERR